MKNTQLTLFDAPFIGYNKAIEALLKLDCIEARERLKHWQECFPGQRDLSLEFDLIDFLDRDITKRALEKDPLAALYLWEKEWEEAFEKKRGRRSLIGLFRKAYFKKASENVLALEKSEQEIESPDLMLCLSRGEYYHDVIRLGKRLAMAGKATGRILGYLADSLFETGKLPDAMQTYLTATLDGPEEIDLKALCHEGVRKTLTLPHEMIEEFFGETVSLRTDNRAEWAATAGLLTRLFTPPFIDEATQIVHMHDQVKQYRNGGDEFQSPGVTFARCIILSEQGDSRLSAIKIDIADIRRVMRDIHEPLFLIYMQYIATSHRQRDVRPLHY